MIPLERTGNIARFEVDGKPCEVDLSSEIDREMQLSLLRKSVYVSNRHAVDVLKEYAKEGTPKRVGYHLTKRLHPLMAGRWQVRIGTSKECNPIFRLTPQIGLAISVSSGG